MYFEPSTFVEAGDVLFLIEPQAYQAAYDEAVATVASAESELNRAQSDLERIEQAIQSDAVSRQDLDRATATRDQAQAALLAARARRDQAALNLEYTQVVTPVSGQVSRNLVDLGNLVGASEPTLLTTVTQIQPIWVYFNAAENQVLSYRAAEEDSTRIGAGDRRVGVVEVAAANETGYPHLGEIDFIDNTVDPATGTIELRAILPNDDLVLFSGLFVRLRVRGPIRQNAILVEEQALGTDLGGKYVMVVGDDNVVEQRYVTLEAAQDDGDPSSSAKAWTARSATSSTGSCGRGRDSRSRPSRRRRPRPKPPGGPRWVRRPTRPRTTRANPNRAKGTEPWVPSARCSSTAPFSRWSSPS